jgi:DNA repair protein RadC
MPERPRDHELHEAAAAERGGPREPVDLPRALRPREKLFTKGPAILSSGELLALVLGAGGGQEPATQVADRLMRRHGLKGLAGLSAKAWRSEKNIGVASAARLCAAFELGRRAHAIGGEGGRPRVNGPRQAFRLVKRLSTAKKEHLIGLYLDAQNGLLCQETVSIGSLNTTRTHPREILFPAVANLALGFILVHNHPSGCLEPSQEDVEFTQVVRRAGEMMGIELYDHLIVAAGGYSSFRERGLL